MRHTPAFQRLLSVVVSLSATTLFLTVALPHQHDGKAAAHHASSSCRICKIHDAFSAVPIPSVAPHVPLVVEAHALCVPHAPCARVVARSCAPRAPPLLS